MNEWNYCCPPVFPLRIDRWQDWWILYLHVAYILAGEKNNKHMTYYNYDFYWISNKTMKYEFEKEKSCYYKIKLNLESLVKVFTNCFYFSFKQEILQNWEKILTPILHWACFTGVFKF